MEYEFSKYQGTGNDFIIMDNRSNRIHLSTEQIAFICDRKKGIGADGLMLLGIAAGYDFSMTYYNADGKEGSMCGNGGRCLVQFAHTLGIIQHTTKFIAIDGPHEASIHSESGWIHLKMCNVSHIETVHQADQYDYITNTGSPHYITFVNALESFNVVEAGKKIRYNDRFHKEGINVNFVENKQDRLFVRTYERGVENETLSCGTGVTAAAITSKMNLLGQHEVTIETIGGMLAVKLNNKGNNQFEDIWLMGPAQYVFKGIIQL